MALPSLEIERFFTDSEIHLFKTLRRTIRPFTDQVKTIIMHASDSSPEPLSADPPFVAPDPSKYKLPSMATRRTGCTHMTMDRLYGGFICSLCRMKSEMGYLYCCAQDHGQPFSPGAQMRIADPGTYFARFGTPSSHNDAELVQHDAHGDPLSKDEIANDEIANLQQYLEEQTDRVIMPSPKLAPWIEKAIEDGHYIPEQIVILRAQKQHLADTAKSVTERYEQELAAQIKKVTTQPIAPTTPQMPEMHTLDTNPHLPYPVIQEAVKPQSQQSGASTPQTPPIHPMSSPGNAVQILQQNRRLFPYCRYLICQVCRPTFKDRAWARFEEAYATEDAPSLDALECEYYSAPMASASVLQKIGLRKYQPKPPRPRLQTFDNRDVNIVRDPRDGRMIISESPASSTGSPTSTSSDITSATSGAERAGPRKNITGFVQKWLERRQGVLQSKSQLSSPELTRGAAELEEMRNQPGGLRNALVRALSEEALQQATKIALPADQNDDLDDNEMDEVDVTEGLAVTEEAADLGSADLILSV